MVVKEPIRPGKKEATPQVSPRFDRRNLGHPWVPPPLPISAGDGQIFCPIARPLFVVWSRPHGS